MMWANQRCPSQKKNKIEFLLDYYYSYYLMGESKMLITKEK
jgi:hypothetical protein